MAYSDTADVERLLVREGWDTAKLDGIQIVDFIDDANLIVDEQLAELSERRKEKIEARLAGHFILSSGIDELRQAQRIQTSDNAAKSFAGSFTQGLRSTSLGQHAIMLDTTGTLANLDMEEDIPHLFEAL